MTSQGASTMARGAKPVMKSISAALMLSRIPIVTPELTKIESQYYKYQSELEKRLMWSFPQYYYFKRGTLAERRFVKLQKPVVSKQPGVWFPKGVPDIKLNRERSRKQDIILPRGAESDDVTDISRAIKPNSRVTEADEKNDITSLERKLARTLYLVVKDNSSKWRFPSVAVPSKNSEVKPLHELAEANLRSLSRHDINTWTVSNTPIGVLEQESEAEFIIKSHIISGKFELLEEAPYSEHAWLSKDEIEGCVDPSYFDNVKFLLSDI
ncbi:HCL573Wp [Eremothecium sinecaudum]|uniref:Large ribosomal subunit protein mL46 n=1 Tax=Eremothecium sinecaudum TaxID=45286 RepID=A0A109UXX7_9SACH|nr:HCL573Wp [Eremothecium sinecaudum]AMD19578.1 HCL573Wp [Eremothecium sinecaudum]